ncbi:hypothetical protein [African swine fever virus]|uniref:Uncharacterized protein n=1 Tax=African swine fever virus TaxID=10497 RepID=A0A3G1EUT1_ASF|nr:hypothetical protein F8221_gp025 [African swine fever virus]AOO54330.1 hypothetical protein AFSV47Ss_0025 [African swine fever virus]QIM06666.1 hypothetical protein [African swine fever virus]QIM06901.1 hypothetical protein [African swine fever virus]QIM07136.1 hypothetical protein [African swine fever virus]QIM07371.1 hypothetical protein [African swine fever virus]
MRKKNNFPDVMYIEYILVLSICFIYIYYIYGAKNAHKSSPHSPAIVLHSCIPCLIFLGSRPYKR